mmetsp:Transcript_6137/g.17575  ORF Transcript_6137/g.17575 Transcript_6137/m.17575 type:complete len:141 (-) Transcript_6137:322-744(-)
MSLCGIQYVNHRTQPQHTHTRTNTERPRATTPHSPQRNALVRCRTYAASDRPSSSDFLAVEDVQLQRDTAAWTLDQIGFPRPPSPTLPPSRLERLLSSFILRLCDIFGEGLRHRSMRTKGWTIECGEEEGAAAIEPCCVV